MITRLAPALVFLVAATISSVSPALAGSVGNMPGTFIVSRNGDAQYSIPIWTPPGIHGVQPNLALVYDSQSGAGIMGPGWSISGLSSIYRCNSTFAQDPAPSAVTLTMSDRFCLDGKRLRLTSSETLSTYGQASTTYETEVADFSLVTASSAQTGSGPSYFTVQGKDGLTYEYGNTGNSQILAPNTTTPYIWALDKVTDRAGNTMTYAYTQAGGSYVVSSIEYTAPSGSTTFLYQVAFTYGALPAAGRKTSYVAGSQVQQTAELSSIAVQLAGTTTDLRLYSLGYSASTTTARATLTSIQECGGAEGTDCLPATHVVYQSGTEGVATPTTSTGGTAATAGAVYTADVDGDGRADLIYAVSVNNDTQMQWWVQLASASGYGAPINTGAVTSTNILVDDFTTQGQSEILADISGTWYSYRWNGSSFTPTSTGVGVVANAVYASADVNGDGLPDLVYVQAIASSPISVQINNSQGSAISFAAAVSNPLSLACCAAERGNGAQLLGNNGFNNSNVKHLDFDGDGRQDLILVYPTATGFAVGALLSRGTGPFVTPDITVTSNYPQFVPVRWNDDACTDLVVNTTIYVSACDGTVQSEVALPSNILLAIDWNGDGRSDLFTAGAGATTYSVTLSQGTSTVGTAVPTGVTLATGNLIVTDPNGDGLDDLVAENESTYALSYGLHEGADTPPDLAISFTDGYGNSVKPSYTSIVPGNGSTFFPQKSVAYPYQNFLKPYYVTASATFSDPTNPPNGNYSIYYYYAGAAMSLQGRGFAGMGTLQTYDPRTAIYDSKVYNTEFPYTGMLTLDVADLNNLVSTLLYTKAATLTASTLDATRSNQRYFPYASNVTKKAYETAGSENTDLVTTISTTYVFDNFGNAINVAKVVTDNDPGSPFVNDTWTSTTATTMTPETGTWCLNVPTETQVTNSSTAPNIPQLTRTVTYTPDYTNCRVSGKVTAPGMPYQVSEVYGFDGFGNVNSDAVTGTGMATRTTGITWGTTGQFPTVITNALGQSITFGYDPNTGNVSSQTDPNYTTSNPLQTTWAYDDFGRKILETRQDHTSTAWSYNACTGCDPRAVLDVTQQTKGTSGTVITTTNLDIDHLNRTIFQVDTLLSGATVNSKVTSYDSLGRVASQSFPYLTGGSSPGSQTYSYDALNRVTQSQRPISATNSTPQTTLYGYAGRTSTIQDALGNTTTKINYVTGQMARSIDAKGYYQNFAYDAFGSLTAVTDSASNALFSARYAYGLAAFQIATTDMDMGSWGYTVDPLGEVTAHTDAKGQNFSQTYDALSRPLIRTEPDLTTTWTWGTSAPSYNIGKLASITSAGATGTYSETYGFDSDSRLSSKAIIIPGHSYTYAYAYDATTGLPSSLSYPGIYVCGTPQNCHQLQYQLVLNYGYSYGILTSVTDASTGTAYWTADATNARGQITQETLGNGVVTDRVFDAVTSWVSSIQAGVGGGATLLNSALTYDDFGDVTQRQNNNLGLTENFYYDTDYRLDHSTLNGTLNLQMGYDTAGMGNIASRSDIAGGAGWTYDPVRKHAVTQAGSYVYTYDANGNQISRSGNPVGWTSYNYPAGLSTSNESVTFQYGPNRDRWQTIYSGSIGTETTYHVGKLLEDVANPDGVGGEVYRYYIYAGSEPVAVNNVETSSPYSSTLSYVLEDHQGSASSLVTSTGSLDVAASFTAFGNRRNGETWSGAPTGADETVINKVSRQGYTWQTALGVSMGLNHMNGRIQDAITGRFLSPDPQIPNSGNTQDFNRYSYARNNPLTFKDPSGLDEIADDLGGDGGGGDGDGGGGLEGGITVTSTPITNGDSDELPEQTVTVPAIPSSSVPADPGPPLQEIVVTNTPIKPPAISMPPIQNQAQSQNPACTKYPRQAAFVNANLPDATQIANQLNTSPGNILGLAGFESGWGGGPLISAGTNNYFSLKAGPSFATGATGSYQYGVNTFWTYSGPGMLASGNAFAQSYFGARVNGATSPQDFAASLNAGGKYNGSPTYNATLVSTINQANAVMGCP